MGESRKKPASRGLPPWSLNRYFNWRDLLGLLGAPPPIGALPCATTCPLCRGDMQALDDAVTCGAWYRCFACGFRGDSIMLAAAAWRIPPDQAVRRAARLGAPIPDRYLDEAELQWNLECGCRAYGRALLAADAAARRYLTAPGETTAELRRSLGSFDPSTSLDRWMRTGGRFVGAATVRQLLGDLGTLGMKYDEAGASPSRRNLTGDGRELLVIPAWDLPGRISGFGVLDRQGGSARLVFKPTIRQRQSAASRPDRPADGPDAGLFMYPATQGRSAAFGHAVFALDDAADAARIHLRHFRDDDAATLPLVAWWEGGRIQTRHCWGQFAGRPAHLWPRAITPCVAWQAHLSGGRIVYPDGEGRADRLASMPPARLLEWMADVSVDWREAVRRWLDSEPRERAVNFIAGLRMQPHVMERLGGGVSYFDSMIAAARAPAARFACVNGRRYYEHPEGWHREFGPVVAPYTPFTIRIRTEISCPDSGRTFLSGELQRDGQVHPFFTQAAHESVHVRKHWVYNLLRRQPGVALPAKGLQCNLMASVARAFNPPAREVAPTAMGWSRATQSFVFPCFRILANGDVEPYDVRETLRTPRRAPPCVGHGEWRELDEADFRAATPASEAGCLYWATTALVANMLLAPITGAAVRNAGFAMGAARVGLTIARSLGCPDHTQYMSRPDRANGRKPPWPHGWPAVIDCRARTCRRGILRSPPRSAEPAALVAAGDLDVALRALTGSYDAIASRSDRVPRKPPAAPDDGVLPAYLRDLARRRFHLPGAGDHARRIVEDMAAWVERNGGSGRAVRAANSRLLRAGHSDEAELLAFFLAALAASRPNMFAPVREGEPVVFRRSTLLRMLDVARLQYPSPAEFDEIFLAAGLPRTSRRSEPEGPAWGLPAPWLSEMLGRFRITM